MAVERAETPPQEPITDGRYQLAYEEGLRAIQQQQAVLESLRSRGVSLVGASAVFSAFFAGLALKGQWNLAAVAGLASFVALSFLILVVLWPNEGWIFRRSTTEIIEFYIEPGEDRPLTLDEMYKELALHFDTDFAKNETKLEFRMKLYRAAVILLVVETVSWVVALAIK